MPLSQVLHLLLVTRFSTVDGELYMMGSNYSGQIGDGTNNDIKEPFHVTLPDAVDQVVCGFNFTMVIAKGRTKAYGFGRNVWF